MVGAAHLKPVMTPPPGPARKPGASAVSAMSGFAAALVTLAAVILGVVLAVVFAATVAVVMVLRT